MALIFSRFLHGEKTKEPILTIGNIHIIDALTLIVLEGGKKKKHFQFLCPCSHNNNTALIKQISLFDTALVMTNT